MHEDELIENHKNIFSDHEKRLRELERLSNERTIKLLNFDERFASILKAIENLTEKVDDMKDNFDARLLEMETRINEKIEKLSSEVDDRLKPLEQADGEKWKKFVWLVVSAAIAGAVGYVFGKLKGG